MANRICSISECENDVAVRGWCWKHYQRWRVHGVADLPDRYWVPGCLVPACQIAQFETCHFEGCDHTHQARGLCSGHYRQHLAGKPPRALRDRRPNGETSLPCEFEACPKLRHRGGLCVSHYEQKVRGKPLTPLQPRMPGGVSVAAVRDAQGRKRCSGCGGWKPETSFGTSKGKGDGLNWRCRVCCSAIARASRLERMGITAERYEELLASQGGTCAICDRKPGKRSFDIDHDHSCCPANKSCGKCIRGLLCAPCNKGIGLLGDSVARISDAVDYLKRTSARLL